MSRVAVLTSHPIQYQAPLFRELARRPGTDLKVFFCWDFGTERRHDPGFGMPIQWDVPLLGGYEHEFLRNLSKEPGTHHRMGLVNPEVVERIVAASPEAVIVHGYAHWTEQHAIRALARRGIPVLLRGESNLIKSRPPWLRAAKQLGLRYLFRHISAYLAIGSLNGDYYRHYGIPDDRVFLAPYSVDNDFFARNASASSRSAAAWREELGIGPETPVVLYAAKLIEAKACDVLIRAFARSRDHGALVLVGSGPLEGELRALASRVSAGSAHFVGFVNQARMPAAYSMGDLFVLPSRYEPWGLAVNEAMCAGLPVIVSDQVGCGPDLVSEQNGWVFPAGDEQALAAALTEAVRDRVQLAARGAASRERIATWGIRETADGFLAAVDYVRSSDPVSR